MVRDQLGTYALAWYIAGALSIAAAALSLEPVVAAPAG
jgi:hypothetical protein